MVFTPVTDNNRFPIWEVSEIEIPEKFETLFNNPDFYKCSWRSYTNAASYRSRKLKQPPGRSKFVCERTSIHKLLKPVTSQVVKFVKTQQDYNLNHTWPPFYIDSIDEVNETMGVEVIQDMGGYDMGAHLDNNLMVFTFIFNLIDNPRAGTEYYTDETASRVLYKANPKKGYGVLHVNTPYLWHNGVNRTKRVRQAVMCNYGVNFVDKSTPVSNVI